MKPFRKEKVASLIRQIVGEAIIHELTDPRIELLTTVSRVEVTSDLQIARVYVNVPGGDANERKTMAALESAHGVLQRLVASNVSMRHCPQLVFAIDELGKRALTTLQLIEANKREREAEDADHAQPDGEHAADSVRDDAEGSIDQLDASEPLLPGADDREIQE